MHAAIFFGKDHSKKLHPIRNTGHDDVTQPSMREQELEISGVSELSWVVEGFLFHPVSIFLFVCRCQLTDVSHRHKFTVPESEGL